VKVSIVGGGLAGLSAALELADSGHEVTLYEARPTLGGAVQTLPPREGDPEPPPDNGQHIALGCFTEYLRFLERIGESGSIRRRPLELTVIDEHGRTAEIKRSGSALLRYRHISLGERARVVKALVRWSTNTRAQTFGDELRARGQSERAVERFWDVFIRPALNLRADEASAEAGVFTVRTALLGSKADSDLVLPVRPLGEMHGEAARRALEEAGATVETGTRVSDLDNLEADAVVVAVPSTESARLLGEPDPALEDSPIVSVHLLFDRRLLSQPLAALLGSPAHWIFDRGLLTGHQPEQGQYLTVVSSGAPELEALRGRELVDLIAGSVTDRLGPAELLWSRVSREPSATIAVRPDTEARRPGPQTGRANVARAGAWTATGWPPTMEGAVRSGRAAARVLAKSREEVAA
jgi:squalene-associated FAD-dependent desaturase